jgi:carbonic anhydrase/acetyltransferase-like protein (isoleucine patch superfamily)
MVGRGMVAVVAAILAAAGVVAGLSASARGNGGASFVDPTASGFEEVELGELVYVAPFAVAKTGRREERSIRIGDESDVQDSVFLNARRGAIVVGEQVALAHGSAVVGPASIGEEGSCPPDPGTGEVPERCPSFLGFNAVVHGAVVEKDAMVGHLARVAPGVRIPSGKKVLPGRFVRTQNQVATKTADVVAADRSFMAAVIEVNTAFAAGYAELKAEARSNVRGINFNPETTFNDRDLPRFAGVPTRDASFRNRIIGDVQLADLKRAARRRMGERISLRADEGDPFQLGGIRAGDDDDDDDSGMADRFTVHALESTQVALGPKGTYGFHSLVHGGPAPFNPTQTGRRFTLGDFAVFFNSRAGNHVKVGAKSLVQQADLPSGSVVPRCTVQVGATRTPVEWCRVPFPLPEGDDD